MTWPDEYRWRYWSIWGFHTSLNPHTGRFSFGTPDGRPLHVELAALEAPLREYAVTSSASPGPVKLIRDGKGGHRLKTVLRKPPSMLSGHSPVQAAPGERWIGTHQALTGMGHVLTWDGGKPIPEEPPATLPFAEVERIAAQLEQRLARARAQTAK